MIPHGVDPVMFRPRPPDAGYRVRLGAPGRQPLVLFVGRLTWEKGVLTLVHAIRLLLDDPLMQNRDVRFALVGRGSEKRRLERLIDRLGLRRQVRLVSGVAFQEMPDLLSAADLFVLPSIASRRVSEQFGHVLLQSMACGRPVVCTDCGPMLEVVGDAAITVPQNDAHSLAEALRRVLLDDSLRRELVTRGHERIRQRFTAEQVGGQLRQLYREVLGMAAPGAAPTLERRLPQPAG
ncbi:MAG TPA: glycosyltransferase family 4 protein [Gemmatimonadales bacterium]|nr:glycosyltransferase family 4 protein [Gemmatimonadales bacterium]